MRCFTSSRGTLCPLSYIDSADILIFKASATSARVLFPLNIISVSPIFFLFMLSPFLHILCNFILILSLLFVNIFFTISMYERGQRELNFETLELIADYFNVDMNYLMGKSNIKNSYRIIESEDSDTDTELCRPYPVIGEVAAGYGSEAIEEETGNYEQIPLEWLRGHNPENFFVLRVKGDSIFPDYQDGDLVLVHRQASVDSGAVGVVLYEGRRSLRFFAFL